MSNNRTERGGAGRGGRIVRSVDVMHMLNARNLDTAVYRNWKGMKLGCGLPEIKKRRRGGWS
jgi:hypothetical protein